MNQLLIDNTVRLFHSLHIYIENQKIGYPEKIPYRSIKIRTGLKKDKIHEDTSESRDGKIITREHKENSFILQALNAVLSFHCTLGITHVSN